MLHQPHVPLSLVLGIGRYFIIISSMSATSELSGNRVWFLTGTLNATHEFWGFQKPPDRAKEFGFCQIGIFTGKGTCVAVGFFQKEFQTAEEFVSSIFKYKNCTLKETMWELVCKVRVQKEGDVSCGLVIYGLCYVEVRSSCTQRFGEFLS